MCNFRKTAHRFSFFIHCLDSWIFVINSKPFIFLFPLLVHPRNLQLNFFLFISPIWYRRNNHGFPTIPRIFSLLSIRLYYCLRSLAGNAYAQEIVRFFSFVFFLLFILSNFTNLTDAWFWIQLFLEFQNWICASIEDGFISAHFRSNTSHSALLATQVICLSLSADRIRFSFTLWLDCVER